MQKKKSRINLITFASESQLENLQGVLVELGYGTSVFEGRDWAANRGFDTDYPIVFFFGQKVYPQNKVRFILGNINETPKVGILQREGSLLEPIIISQFNDFVVWPCERQELALRIERACSCVTYRQNTEKDLPSLEEFAQLSLIGKSPSFKEVIKRIKRIARCDAPVVIEGETGTGKELAARAIHFLSARHSYPFLPFNCGAVPDNLIENELFGHERGAFTDAKESRLGLVAQAEGGTLFLDEVDTLSLRGQVALLRFLQNREYRPLGNGRTNKANVRILAATNADLDQAAKIGEFRQDLLFRLNVMSITMPPLRERTSDVEMLANHFIQKCSTEYKNGGPKSLHPDTIQWMKRYDWPGNIRELENFIHREFLLADDVCIRTSLEKPRAGVPEGKLSFDAPFNEIKQRVVAEFEREYLSWLMRESRGNVTVAAKLAKKERRALGKLLKKYGIDRKYYIG